MNFFENELREYLVTTTLQEHIIYNSHMLDVLTIPLLTSQLLKRKFGYLKYNEFNHKYTSIWEKLFVGDLFEYVINQNKEKTYQMFYFNPEQL